MSEPQDVLDRVLAIKSGPSGPVVNIDEPKVKLLVLTLGEEVFAIRGEFVREVLSDQPVFFLPGGPPSLEGVISVRDEIETVVDLRQVLGLPKASGHLDSRILLVKTADMQSGVRVDRVDDVADVAQSDILPAPSTIADARKAIVQGVTEIRGTMATLLDIERIFRDYRDGLLT